MRVLQLGKYYSPIKGGIEQHLQTLSEGLVKAGVSITCFVFTPAKIGTIEILRGVHVHRFGKIIKSVPPLNLLLPFYLKKYQSQHDIVHLHMPNPCAEISCLLTKPKNLIVTYHADIVHKKGSRLFLPFQKKVLQQAKKILVSSESYLHSSPTLKKFKHKCVIIPFGIDIEQFNKVSKEKVRKIKAKMNPPLYLFVGRFVSYKGLKYAVQAMKKVNGTLLLVGQGPLLKTLKKQVNKLHLNTKVHFLSEVSDKELPYFYHAADIFILPSIHRAEAFGIVQLEAMACAKPVISTQLGTGVSMINLHKKTGLVIQPKNIEALCSAMNILGSNKTLSSKLGKCGRKRAEKFTTSRMVETLIDIYKQVLYDR